MTVHGRNDRSRPATGRGKSKKRKRRRSPFRSEKSPWDSFDNDRPSRGERSSESGERGGRERRTESGERGGRERSSESGERRTPFTRGRSDSNDGEKRPYQRRGDSGESKEHHFQEEEEVLQVTVKRDLIKEETTAEVGERSSERKARRRGGVQEAEKRRTSFTRGRSDSNDGEKRPYPEAESGEQRAEAFGEKRSYTET
ncbi:MAG: hypothetical protein IPK10_09650 [Bacteroidetes bacterium]|nr:hypothetical protein [Bacteroidota bacterium]